MTDCNHALGFATDFQMSNALVYSDAKPEDVGEHFIKGEGFEPCNFCYKCGSSVRGLAEQKAKELGLECIK